jgi:hypothetical protein
MKFFLPLLATICIVSCKKNDTQPISSTDILMAHSWFPYQKEIVTVDSNTIVTADSVGHVQTKTTVKNSDTTFLTSQCLQQSVYSFQQNGTLTINNMCNASTPNINGTWTITQTNILSIQYATGNNSPFPLYYSSGLVANIENSSFIYHDSESISNLYSTSYGPNNSIINAHEKVLTEEYTTYKSK